MYFAKYLRSTNRNSVTKIMCTHKSTISDVDQLYRPPQETVTIACDLQSALQQVFGPNTLSPKQADYDLLSQTCDILREFTHISFLCSLSCERSSR